MTSPAAGTTTLVLTDIEGSTLLLQRLGDRYADLLADHHRLLREVFGDHDGVEIDTTGDGMYYHFPSARAGIAAAVAAQRALADHAWPDGVEVKVRIGIHTGEPVRAEVGLVGLDVHRTARICAAGHGRQILVSRTTRDLAGSELPAGVSLTDLGEHRLKDLAEPQHLFQVEAPGLPDSYPPLRTLDDRPTNLPRRLSTFVGRDRELEEARALLASSPLVTLIGPGGVGKTRLALQVSLSMLADLPDGIWLVELGALTDPSLVGQAIAAALRVTEDPGRPLDATIIEFLRTRHLCIVLDNCEHLLEACAQLAYAIVSETDTRILATSREALAVEGERVLPVGSLDLPDNTRSLSASAALQSAAVRLFVDRATASHPLFRLTDENASTVVQICQRLDGMPLAIELAAARVRAIPVDQLAARLDDRFRLLTGGTRLAVTRHQTLRATMDWSHELLSAEDRAILRRLAAFAGGCSLAAAEAVTAGDPVDESGVLDALTRLVDKSLLIADSTVAEARFSMHETIRHYAREKLIEAGEAEAVLRRHRDWVLAMVEKAKPAFFRGPPPRDWLAVFDRESDNLRQALEWTATEADGAAVGLRLAAGLWRYWEIRSKLVEGRAWLERTLAATDGEVSLLRANALTGAAILAHHQGDYRAAIAYHEQSLAQHREMGNRPSVGYALANLANVRAEHGDLAQARSLYQEAIRMALALGDERGAATAMISLGDVVSRETGYDDARAHFAEAVAVLGKFDDRWGTALALDTEGQAAARAGEYERARSLHRSALAIAREIGDDRSVARSLTHLASVAAAEGDVAQAKALHRECLHIRQALNDTPGIAVALEKLAGVVMNDSAEGAARLLGTAQSLRETVNTPLPPAARADYQRCVQVLIDRLGEEGFDAARLEGRRLDVAAAVEPILGTEEPLRPLPAPG